MSKYLFSSLIDFQIFHPESENARNRFRPSDWIAERRPDRQVKRTINRLCKINIPYCQTLFNVKHGMPISASIQTTSLNVSRNRLAVETAHSAVASFNQHSINIQRKCLAHQITSLRFHFVPFINTIFTIDLNARWRITNWTVASLSTPRRLFFSAFGIFGAIWVFRFL